MTASTGNTIAVDASIRNAFFTWNNYTKDDIKALIQFFKTSKKYLFQEETGDNGTPHLQGVVCFSSSKTFQSLKNFNKNIHWERCISVKKAAQYCSKLDTRSGETFQSGFDDVLIIVDDPLAGLPLYGWQNEILNLMKQKPDKRKIYWYWDEFGNTGKTSFAKHLCINYNCLYVSGKTSDVKYGVTDWILKKKSINIIVYHVPRSYGKISYEVLENIKDGIFYNSKYESSMVMFNCPHLIVFANFEPIIENLSMDRWCIKKLESSRPDISTTTGD